MKTEIIKGEALKVGDIVFDRDPERSDASKFKVSSIERGKVYMRCLKGKHNYIVRDRLVVFGFMMTYWNKPV